ncbi:hypothetical protein OEZ86_010416 [Tetradesmus obliquus]|nr:hypothetical protein OEZ86_010416 [Tetradesmus obliquus]
MVCVDVLFWQLPRDCEYIRDEYHLQEGGTHAAGGRKGAGGMPKPRTMARLLNPAQEQRLVTFFEQLCADRANMAGLMQQMGGRLGPRQLASEMKRLGLKFGRLPPSLMRQLHQLWQENRDSGIATAAAVIAQDLPGGWNEKQVRRLLRAEGLTGNGGGGKWRQQRPGGSSDDDDDADGWDSTAEGGDVLLGVEKQQMERLYAQHLADEDYLAKIADKLSAEHPNASAADVLATLCFHDIVEKPTKQQQQARGARRGGNADTRRVSKALLQSLCARHGTEPDGLNLTAMALGLTVLEVQKLLVKRNVSGERSSSSSSEDDDADSEGEGAAAAAAAGGKRRGRLAGSSRAAAAAAADDDAAGWEDEDAAAAADAAGADKAKTKSSSKKQRRAPRPLTDVMEDEAGGVSAAAAAAAAAAAGVRRVGSVPEPQPLQLLGYLQALQQAHQESQRWLDARGAVGWLLGKLEAAEAVWKAAADLTGAAPADYCLVPGAGDDLDFFCSDWSNELLVAAGVRNDSGDYFKIPGNSTPAWRSRVRGRLQKKQRGSAVAAAGDGSSPGDASGARRAALQEITRRRQQQQPAAAAAAKPRMVQLVEDDDDNDDDDAMGLADELEDALDENAAAAAAAVAGAKAGRQHGRGALMLLDDDDDD